MNSGRSRVECVITMSKETFTPPFVGKDEKESDTLPIIDNKDNKVDTKDALENWLEKHKAGEDKKEDEKSDFQ